MGARVAVAGTREVRVNTDYSGWRSGDLPEPFSGLAAAVEPLAWPQGLVPVTYIGAGPGPWFWVELEALVKPPPGCEQAPHWDRAGEDRKAFCARAEEVIAAVAQAGWTADEPPEILVRGRLGWPDGRHAEPVIHTEATVRMRLIPPAE